MTTVGLHLDADRLVLLPLLDGREMPGRSAPHASTQAGDRRMFVADWPSGTVADAVGVAADLDGPVLYAIPLGRKVRYPDGTVSVDVPVRGTVLAFAKV